MKKQAKPVKKQTQKAGSLTISKADKVPLSKNQQEFNKQTARIEKLRKEIDRKTEQFDTAIQLFSTNIYPLQQQVAQQQRELLTVLWPLYKKQQLPRGDQSYFKKMLRSLMQDILDSTPGEPDEEVKKIFKDLEGERYETVLKREKAQMKDEMQEMFEGAGIDVDLNDIDLGSEDMAAKVAEAQRNMQEKQQQRREQWQQNRAARPKTAKQLEKEKMQQAVDEMKQKNISTIYRQLAKLFHPDLEQDEQRRAEKEVLMKELTSAYEAKNLHALLTLELKWIHNEQGHLETLTEEKLAVYLQILKEQARELELEKNQLINKPQYHILIEEFGYREMTYPLKTITAEQQNLESKLTAMKNDAVQLKGSNAVKHLRQILKELKAQEEYEDSFGFDAMMRMMETNMRNSWG